MIVERAYQTEAERSIWEYFRTHTGNPLVVMPTGTGKSVIVAKFCWNALNQYPGTRILVLTHVKELVAQNYGKLLTIWPGAPAGIYSAGLNRRELGRSITFGGIASIVKQADNLGRVDLVIIDEADLVSDADETMYRKLLTALTVVNPFLKVIGLTATPWRAGVGKIARDQEGSLFTHECFNISTPGAFNRLIAEGYLSPLVARNPRGVLNIDGVHMRGGEFVAGELQAAVDKEEVTLRALHECLELASDRGHWLVFASGVEHANHIAEALEMLGVSAVSITSKMSADARDEAILGFKSGKYRAAVNNNVLTTGFDFPAIDCIVMLRPTASSRLWVQMLGRGTRPSPDTGKENCLVLDFAKNTLRLGPINDPVIPVKKGEAKGEAPVRLCDNCECYNHASAKFCAYCGAEFSFKVKINAGASEEELIRGDTPEVRVYKVDHISYSVHSKIDKPDAMRVTYYSGIRNFSEYVCVAHDGFARRKAASWWAERTTGDGAMPDTAEQALSMTGDLRHPTHLRIWINKKYPEILAHDYSGTAFGAEPASKDGVIDTPTADVKRRSDVGASFVRGDAPASIPSGHQFDDMDDDIPF